RRRGKTGGKVAKTQRRKTLRDRNVPKTVDRRGSLALAKKTDATRLTRELQAALEQQTAMAEVLRVISSSPTNIGAVLDVVSENAARLCDANNSVIWRLDGDRLRAMANACAGALVMANSSRISRRSRRSVSSDWIATIPGGNQINNNWR